MITNLTEYKEFIKNKKIAVIGLGISNQALIRFLNDCGAFNISVFDKTTADSFIKLCDKLVSDGAVCDYYYGNNYLSHITEGGYDVIFRSPIVRYDTPEIARCVANGSILTSEVETVLQLAPCKTYGVTGSDGKTTTTTLISKFLSARYENTDTKIWLGGNIGFPLIDKLPQIKNQDRIVLELSSFQLMDMKISTDVAVITNISPNHLDVHKSYDEYAFAKKSIFAFQNQGGRLILNATDEMSARLLGDRRDNVFYFSAKTDKVPDFSCGSSLLTDNGTLLRYKDNEINLEMDRSHIRIPGFFNIENFLAAMCAVKDEANILDIIKATDSFYGVEHRLEFVRELNDVFYFNSSIDSSPSRTAAALSAFADLGARPIVICGGYDKNIPFEPLAKALKDTAKAVVLTGATATKIKDTLESEGVEIEVHLEPDFEKAVNLARKIATKHDIVLLSPACASFDSFNNFMERGDKFKKIVNDFR